MKDFDVTDLPSRPVEERMFRLGGEVFVSRPRYRTEVLLPLESLRDAKVDRTTCECQHRLHEHDPLNGAAGPCHATNCDCTKFKRVVIEPSSTLAEQLAAADATLLGMIEPDDDAHARYTKMRESDSAAVTLDQLMDVIKWLTAKDTGHPTGRPDVSTPGPSSTGTPSTESSSSPVTVVV